MFAIFCNAYYLPCINDFISDFLKYGQISQTKIYQSKQFIIDKIDSPWLE